MFLIDKELLRRIEPVGALERLRSGQARVLRTLLSGTRVERLVEQEALDGDQAYPATTFLADLRTGLWRELSDDEVRIDAYRRNVQRVYLDQVEGQLGAGEAGDARSFFRGELRALDRAVAAGLPQVVERATRRHLEDVRDRVAHTLDPAWTAEQEGGRGVAGFTELDGLVNPWQLLGAEYHEACWRDHGITLDRP